MSGQFHVFVYNAEQNAAANAAETAWSVAEAVTHYFIIPYGYQTIKLGYQGAKWLFGGCAAPAAPVPPPAVIPAPPVPQPGLFSWAWNSAKSAVKAVTKTATKLIGPQVISHGINQLWMKSHFWDKYKPLATAFMRPVMEKFLPAIYQIWDKGDINISGREFVPGGSGTWISWVTYPLIKIKVAVDQFIYGQTIVSVNEPFAYELGESFANTADAIITTGVDVLKGTKHVGPCIMNGPSATMQCFTDARAYFAAQEELIMNTSKPLREAAGLWAQGAWDTLNSYSGQLFNLANAGLWGTAKIVESKTGLPAHLVYYVEIGALGYVGYKGIKAGGRLAAEVFRAHLLPAGVNVQQRLFNMWPGHHPAQQPQQPQQPQPPADGAQVHVHGASGAAGAAGAPVHVVTNNFLQANPHLQHGHQQVNHGGGQPPHDGGQPPAPHDGGQPPAPHDGGQPPGQGVLRLQ